MLLKKKHSEVSATFLGNHSSSWSVHVFHVSRFGQNNTRATNLQMINWGKKYYLYLKAKIQKISQTSHAPGRATFSDTITTHNSYKYIYVNTIWPILKISRALLHFLRQQSWLPKSDNFLKESLKEFWQNRCFSKFQKCGRKFRNMADMATRFFEKSKKSKNFFQKNFGGPSPARFQTDTLSARGFARRFWQNMVLVEFTWSDHLFVKENVRRYGLY